MRPTTSILAAAVATAFAAACATAPAPPEEEPDPSSTTTTTTTAPISPAEEQVDVAGSSASLAFNNADAVVVGDGGDVHAVWSIGTEIVHGLAPPDGADLVTSVVRSSAAPVQLATIAIADGELVAAWTEGAGVRVATSGDGGTEWSAPIPLGGAGSSGVSLAADGSTVVAAWHEGDESDGSVWFAARDPAMREWGEPVQVDAGGASAVWASVALVGDDVLVVYRDDRTGAFTVWMRRSHDLGASWLDEQQLVATHSGDPAVCVDGDTVWVGHHGEGRVWLLRSDDAGAHFGGAQDLGPGWFAHLGCTGDGRVAVSWEHTTSPPFVDEGKLAGYAVVDAEGAVLAGGTLGVAPTAGATVAANADGRVEVWWVQVGDEPLTGTLHRARLDAGSGV